MRFVIEAIGLRAAGGKELALNLLRAFSRLADHEFVLLVPDLPEYDALRGEHLTCIRFSRTGSLLRRYLFLNRTVPRICSELRADALLCLGNFAPRRPCCPTVTFLQHPYLVYREPWLEKRLTLREKLIVGYGRRAYRRLPAEILVIVQTEVVRERLQRLYGLDPRRVIVISSSCPFPPDAHGDLVRRKNGAGKPFTFLCLSRYMPHKNFEILHEAMKRLPAFTSKRARCVINISADQHPGARKLLLKIEREGRAGQIVNLGWIPTREEVEQIYQAANAYVLPSLMETFSFTYLEAMRFGLPILASDRDFARHRCGDAALYFDPLDRDSVAKCMARIIEESDLRTQLVSKGRLLLQQVPSWDEVSRQFVAILDLVSRRPVLSAESLKAERAFQPLPIGSQANGG